jgi:hypothetical protein
MQRHRALFGANSARFHNFSELFIVAIITSVCPPGEHARGG